MTSPITMPDKLTPSLQINPYANVPINRPLLFTRKIHAIMNENAPDSFRFVVCDDEKILGSGFGGFSRMAVDPPETPAKLEDRLNIASMSKTLTAAAVLSTLQAKNLSPDALVAPFLPPDWTLHAQVKKLTFRDFLTHRTGFNQATDRSHYAGIKESMEQGPPNPIQANYDYRNINFSTMRLILPQLNAYNRFTKKVPPLMIVGNKPDETLANAYVSIVNQRVLAPSGIAPAGCDSKTLNQSPPKPNLPVLLYEFQQPTKQGVDLGDRTLACGAEGWSLSVVDYAQFLQTLFFTEIIVSEKNRALMMAVNDSSGIGLGINRRAPLGDSDVYMHGAWIPVSMGKAQVAGWYLYLPASKLIVVALSNANHKPDAANWFERVKQAYAEVYAET